MEVVTLGETMVLFNPDSQGPLRYAHNFNMSIAGAESNVAIALARLEHNVGWISRLGNDEFGRYIKSVIRGEGVDVSRVSIDETHQTGLLFKEQFAHANPNIYYYRKHSAASFMGENDIDEGYIASAKILHITGITLALSKSAREGVYKAIDIAKQNGVLVSFDPNIRLKLWTIEEAKPVLLDVAKQADIIFPGIDEGRLLLGLEDYKEITKAFLDMGCKIVATKVGKKGCFISDGKEEVFVEGYVIEKTVDTVGAGDGFAAGFLSGYLRNKSLHDCAKLANAIGAMATLVKGDIEGFPTLSQVNQFMGLTNYIDR
ncbi:sugar kinase [Clostridium swellfunianum]|uniref:sugar kinase n=1 Tax=Clostridium swellfunianum TaxID=1367462 RepID=UPI0020302F46|nr:sugar kinase [Clostridium swellfunianum]MCM0648200.1 sugar kinase [Clostridium swellfunianum]